MTVDDTSEMPIRSGRGKAVDLDVLRGWTDAPDPALRGDHALPAIARLVAAGSTGIIVPFHGPDVYIGRFHPQAGPVDIIPTRLADHEIYKFAAPHARFTYDDGEWLIVPTAPNGLVEIDGRRLEETGIRYPVADGDRLRLGVVEFVFEKGPARYSEWFDAKKELFESASGPTLFLRRSGGVAGASFPLDTSRKNVIGRKFPEPATVGADWAENSQPDWNLSGLFDHESKFVGFRHLELTCEGDDWTITPISLRQRTYLNRVEIVGPTALLPGDEIGLGSVLLHFHHPADVEASTDHRTAELPTVVDWQREHTNSDLEAIEASDPEHDEPHDTDLFGGDDE